MCAGVLTDIQCWSGYAVSLQGMHARWHVEGCQALVTGWRKGPGSCLPGGAAGAVLLQAHGQLDLVQLAELLRVHVLHIAHLGADLRGPED